MPIIAVYPNKILLEPCVAVDEATKVDECILSLVKAFQALGEGCLGLAANQVGFSIRVSILKMDGEPQIMINPRLLDHGTVQVTEREYCYSLPDVSRLVEAWEEIKIEYTDESGERCEREISGYEARAFQHELHHLEGKTILEWDQGNVSSSKLKHMSRKHKGWLYI